MNKNGILIDLSESKRTQFGKVDFAVQSAPQKVFSAIWDLESQVNNGGFSQYLRNTSSETAPFVVEALEAIGAPRTADLCRRAIAVAFPGGMPAASSAISSAAAAFSETTLGRLETLDAEYFRPCENLTDCLFAYVSRHPEEFGPLPKAEDA
jgi:hypothetical protein